MTIEAMREKKRELGYSYAKIAALSGVPVGTVQKILGGITTSPRYETLHALEAVFEKAEGTLIGETLEAYETAGDDAVRKGPYTLDDYLALPDERRVELIDGVFYDMSAPTIPHQVIAGDLYRRLGNFVDTAGGSCVPMIAPVDVQLDCDDKTIVQPDVLVVCDKEKLANGKRVYGAPDLVIEVLSKSTRDKDRFLKGRKYQDAGVREYWMVDLNKEKVIIQDFAHEDNFIFGFDEQIPVGIFDGKCVISLARYKAAAMFLPEGNPDAD